MSTIDEKGQSIAAVRAKAEALIAAEADNLFNSTGPNDESLAEGDAYTDGYGGVVYARVNGKKETLRLRGMLLPGPAPSGTPPTAPPPA